MNRHYSEFPERKLTESSTPRATPGGTAAKGRIVEKTTKWPKVGRPWGSSFNRTSKVKVVKVHPVSWGTDG